MDVLQGYGKLSEKQTWAQKAACEEIIEQIREQNNDCKNKLADLLLAIFSPNLIDQAEVFQSRFLMTDDAISILRSEMTQLERFLQIQKGTDRIVENVLGNISLDLYLKAKKVEQTFHVLKEEFSVFLSHIA